MQNFEIDKLRTPLKTKSCTPFIDDNKKTQRYVTPRENTTLIWFKSFEWPLE